MVRGSIPELLLHEAPNIRSIFKSICCELNGGHKYIFVDRAYFEYEQGGMYYRSSYSICEYCQNFKWEDDFEV